MSTTPITLRIEGHHLFVPEHLMRSGTELILITHPLRCLALYAPAHWMPAREKILEYKSEHAQAAALKRLLVGSAHEVHIDEMNRLLVDEESRRFAKLEEIAYWVPYGNMICLWNPCFFDKAATGHLFARKATGNWPVEEE